MIDKDCQGLTIIRSRSDLRAKLKPQRCTHLWNPTFRNHETWAPGTVQWRILGGRRHRSGETSMTEFLISTQESRRVIAVDFDGVIAGYEGWQGEEECGAPRKDVVEALRTLRNEGWKIIVFSCRETAGIVPYLARNSVPYDEVNQNSDYATEGGKPVANVYWDDRALRYSGDAHKDL